MQIGTAIDRLDMITERAIRTAYQREIIPEALSLGTGSLVKGPRTVVLIPGIRNEAGRLDLLARHIETVGHRAYVLEQPERGLLSLDESARDLGRLVDAVSREHRDTDVFLAGFSRGGLVARTLLQGSVDALDATAGLVTIGTPHLGVGPSQVAGSVMSGYTMGERARELTSALARTRVGNATRRVVDGAWAATARRAQSPAMAAFGELMRTSRALRALDADLDAFLGYASRRKPGWQLTAIHGDVPRVAGDGVVATESAALLGRDGSNIKRVHIVGEDARHDRLPEHPHAIRAVLDVLAGRG